MPDLTKMDHLFEIAGKPRLKRNELYGTTEVKSRKNLLKGRKASVKRHRRGPRSVLPTSSLLQGVY